MKKLLASLYAAAVFFGSAALSQAVDLKLTWNSNTESDLAGYKVYQGTQAGGPYTKLGEVLPSPTPSYTWSVPPNTEATYYFVVTAFDNAGNESGYSNEASTYVDNKAPGAPGGLQVIIIIIPR